MHTFKKFELLFKKVGLELYKKFSIDFLAT